VITAWDSVDASVYENGGVAGGGLGTLLGPTRDQVVSGPRPDTPNRTGHPITRSVWQRTWPQNQLLEFPAPRTQIPCS